MTSKTEDNQLNIHSKISDIKGIGKKKEALFNKLGIYTLEDSLSYYPSSYQDFRKPVNICDCINGDTCLIVGHVILTSFGFGYGKKKTLHVLVEDRTGRIEVLFFMAGYLKNAFVIGKEYYFYGKIKCENGKYTMFHPTYGLLSSGEDGILPVYRLTAGLTQKDIRSVTKKACLLSSQLRETLPASVVSEAGIKSLGFAKSQIHYPASEHDYSAAKYRLIFEEFFFLKYALYLSKSYKHGKGTVVCSNTADRFINSLPYKLTAAQIRAINDILSDLRSEKTMNRLVQGDVGSGKTAVAMAALFETVFAGFQGVFMAPTEILAKQHYTTLKSAFSAFNIDVELLISSMSAKEKKEVTEKIRSGEADVIIGTHALISDSIIYKNIGLVITDEQHRFGVSQREKLASKGDNPNILIMTATPIPRTLAVTLFADLDITIIDELPPGRKDVITVSYKENTRKDAYKKLFSELESGHRAYIVAPLIEESDSINCRSALGLYESFLKKHPEIPCGLIHGEMSDDEKDEIMNKFKNGDISVLIATVVIEVGIDVPEATVILVENCERFGLAQLHQLRGRVGRGQDQSFCLLCIGEESEIANSRVDILCKTNDGFVISEKDLENRGPGEFFGYKQHGLPQLSLADPVKHFEILQEAEKHVSKHVQKAQTASDEYFYEVLKNKYLQLENLTI